MAPRPNTFNLNHLCTILFEAGLIDDPTSRDIKVKAPGIEQKILRARAPQRAGRNVRYQVSPAEIVAALELTMPDGRRLNEDCIMEVVATLGALDSGMAIAIASIANFFLALDAGRRD